MIDRRYMSTIVRRILLTTVAIVIAFVVIVGLLAGRRKRASEAAREAPINAAGRMHETQGPLGDEAAIVFDSVEKARAGIAVAVLRAGTSTDGIQLTGELVADPTRITTLRASVSGRVAAVSGHWPALGEHVTSGSVIAQVSDARAQSVPRAGTVTRVSAQPGELVQAGQELLQLTDFTSLLARIAWRPDAPRRPPNTISITPLRVPGLPSSAEATARLVGPAADVDSLTRLPIYLYRTNANWPGARPGAAVQATLAQPDAGKGGVFVPTSAVVQWEGLVWAYVQVASGPHGARFVRRRVDTTNPVTGGWLVASPGALGVHAGDSVAVRGAQELLSEEFRSRVNVGEDADKQ